MAKDTEAVERQLLQDVLGGFRVLDHDARVRILRTVAAYFELDFPQHAGIKQPPAHPLSKPGATREPVFSDHSALSPKNFIFEKSPQTDVDRIACLAYYLSHYRDQPHFKTADLSKLNTEAAQRKLANTAYAVNNATHAGYLAAAPGGQKQLTALGEQYVSALPGREAARAVLERFRDRNLRRASRHAKAQ
jgi:hypothetical protein